MSRLHFMEVASCTFRVRIDPNNTFSNYMKTYGKIPDLVRIPYNLVFNTHFNQTKIGYAHQTLNYKPWVDPNIAQSISQANNIADFSVAAQICRINSSVDGSPTLDVFNSLGFFFLILKII